MIHFEGNDSIIQYAIYHQYQPTASEVHDTTITRKKNEQMNCTKMSVLFNLF